MNLEQLGPYRIVRLLGRGGMGAVYEGINDETDDPAAIKILPAALAVEPDFRQRFSVEIETLRKLYHPNIVQLFGFGEQDGILYYAMELVRGSNLEQELRQGRRFDWREVADIGIQTCRALRHAHDRGIIHRDIKPANLMWTPDHRIKLSDFGIARLFGNTKLTAAGSVLGTAEYMAPEQADARPTGPRTDLYSLGGVLYCLVARRPPFVARSLVEMIEKQRSATPDPVRRHAPECPAELEALIAQLLEKSPEARIPNATLVARRLEAVLAAMSVHPTTAEHKLLRSLQQTPQPPTSPRQSQVGEPRAASLPNDAPALANTTTHVLPAAPSPDAVPETRLATAESPLAAQDASQRDASQQDASQQDASQRDASQRDASQRDASQRDASQRDASQRDASQRDASQRDASQRDASQRDASAPDARRGDSVTAKPLKRFGGTFVTVEQKDLDPVEAKPSPHAAWMSLQTWLLAGSLLAMGLSAWYLLQPASADDLYTKICAATADKTVDSYQKAAPEIGEFLRRFPADSRSETLLGYQREIELRDLEKRFQSRVRRVAANDRLLAIEQAYLDAMNYARLEPDRGLVKLQAVVDLYCDRKDLSGPVGECLALARRQLEQLKTQSEHLAADGKLEIESRLARAEALRTTDPAVAGKILRSIVDVFGEKRWASEMVGQARQALAALPDVPPAAKAPSSPSVPTKPAATPKQ